MALAARTKVVAALTHRVWELSCLSARSDAVVLVQISMPCHLRALERLGRLGLLCGGPRRLPADDDKVSALYVVIRGRCEISKVGSRARKGELEPRGKPSMGERGIVIPRQRSKMAE